MKLLHNRSFALFSHRFRILYLQIVMLVVEATKAMQFITIRAEDLHRYWHISTSLSYFCQIFSRQSARYLQMLRSKLCPFLVRNLEIRIFRPDL